MQHDPKDDSSDSMLAPFLTAKSESISDELLRAIIDEHVDPIIKKILRSKLRVSLNGRGTQQNQDALEIAGSWSNFFYFRPVANSGGAQKPEISINSWM